MKNKRGQTTYKKATKLEHGVSVCNVGYADCPYGGEYHYHCSQCGGVTGMMAHYAGENRPMSCQMTDQEYEDYLTSIRDSIKVKR